VHAFDLLEALFEDLKDVREMKVGEAAVRSMPLLDAEASLGGALDAMRQERTDRLPVIDEHGHTAGMFSYLDLVERYYVHAMSRDEGLPPDVKTKAYTPQKTNILSVRARDLDGSTPVVSIEEQATLPEAVKQMRLAKVRSLLLLEERKPVGMITLQGVLQAVVDSQVESRAVIQYKGFNELSLSKREAEWARKLCVYYAEKISHAINNDFTLNVHAKEHSPEGSTHRYHVQVLVDFAGGGPLNADAVEWDLSAALHSAFQGLEAEAAHRFGDNHRVASVRKLASAEGNPNLPGDLAAK
jgi:CBS domain-containing protein